jgi:hypothetical protein
VVWGYHKRGKNQWNCQNLAKSHLCKFKPPIYGNPYQKMAGNPPTWCPDYYGTYLQWANRKLNFDQILKSAVGERGASWQSHFLWIYLNFLTTRFANWMNKSNSDFNSLWIVRICLQCSFTRNCEIEKNCKKSLSTCPTYGVSWQLTILHCSKISRSNFKNLQLSISWEIYIPTCPSKFLTTNPTGCFSNK